jgi:4-diphosphocytidyl-2C-methyl-D-erythritol kinase
VGRLHRVPSAQALMSGSGPAVVAVCWGNGWAKGEAA